MFSATDLIAFLGCRHATFLDRRNLDEPMPLAAEDPLLALLQEKGLAHERRYLDVLRKDGRSVVEISGRGSVARVSHRIPATQLSFMTRSQTVG